MAGKTLLQLGSGECKFPIEMVEGDWHFCAARRRADDSYCARHNRIAYQPQKQRAAVEPMKLMIGKV